jgi:predicted DNA-binding transcriptional regulator AlpA
MSNQWMVRVTAPADLIDAEAQIAITEELNAGVMVDTATNLLTAVYQVTAPTLRMAVDEAFRAARALPAKPTGLQVLRIEDWIAEQENPRPQDLVGATEAAHLLGVSRQRVAQLAERPDFPAPIARISAGPVWTRASVHAFMKRWARKITGRPRKAASA